MDSDNIEQMDARLREAFSEELPDATELERAVRKGIRAERSRQWLLVTAAAAILLAIAGYAIYGRVHRARVFSDLARDHYREVVRHETRHWRSDSGEIETLAANYGLSGGMAAEMAPPGYRLEHAKTCGMDGRPVLHLVYAKGSEEFSIYVRPRGNSGYSGFMSKDSEQLAAFRTRRFDAVVVTSGPGRECLELARRAAAVL